MNVLFLGAGNRLSLLEAFQSSAERYQISLSMYCMEKDVRVPVAHVAEVFSGPSFRDVRFYAALQNAVQNYQIDIVIPNMDAATVALSQATSTGALHLVSSPKLCQVMEDKYAAKSWFRTHSIPTPYGEVFPRIVKSRMGYGARDQFIVDNEMAWTAMQGRIVGGDYVYEPYVDGPEYTVDSYVSSDGVILGVYIRRRLEVINGEVNVSVSQFHPSIDALARKILGLPGWFGPITLQFIDAPAGPVLIEINPRLGGGVTHAIHGGLDIPSWIFHERMGAPVSPCEGWLDGSLMTRCRRDVFHDPND